MVQATCNIIKGLYALQAYIHKLRVCLEEEGQPEQDAASEQALTKLTIEASSVVCCLTHFNTETVRALHGLMLDTGQPVQHQPGDAFYSHLVVSHFWNVCQCVSHVDYGSSRVSALPLPIPSPPPPLLFTPPRGLS